MPSSMLNINSFYIAERKKNHFGKKFISSLEFVCQLLTYNVLKAIFHRKLCKIYNINPMMPEI